MDKSLRKLFTTAFSYIAIFSLVNRASVSDDLSNTENKWAWPDDTIFAADLNSPKGALFEAVIAKGRAKIEGFGNRFEVEPATGT